MVTHALKHAINAPGTTRDQTGARSTIRPTIDLARRAPPRHAATFVPARKAHPALLVSDLEHVRGALTDAGIEIVLDTQLEGHERFSAHDPFGNRLEFIRARVSPG
jgi:hypothetical protein